MLVVDIETLGLDDVEAEPVSAPAHYKDPEKIAAYVKEKQAEQITRAALYPWTARVIALGWCHEGAEVVTVELCNTEAREAEALRRFWADVVDPKTQDVEGLVTFNGLAFDLPVLMARSRLLRVPAPVLNLDKYRTPHVDLMQKLTWNGVVQARSLKWFAKRFGLNTDDAFSGALIAQLYEDQNWDAITKHVESDVTLTRQLAERLGVLRSRPALVAS